MQLKLHQANVSLILPEGTLRIKSALKQRYLSVRKRSICSDDYSFFYLTDLFLNFFSLQPNTSGISIAAGSERSEVSVLKAFSVHRHSALKTRMCVDKDNKTSTQVKPSYGITTFSTFYDCVINCFNAAM